MCILETERTSTMLWPAWPLQAVPPIPKPPGIVRLSQMHIAIYEQRLYNHWNAQLLPLQLFTFNQRCPCRKTAAFLKFFTVNLSFLRRCKSSAIWRPV